MCFLCSCFEEENAQNLSKTLFSASHRTQSVSIKFVTNDPQNVSRIHPIHLRCYDAPACSRVFHGAS